MFKIVSEEDTLVMQDKPIPQRRSRKEVFSEARLCLYNPSVPTRFEEQFTQPCSTKQLLNMFKLRYE